MRLISAVLTGFLTLTASSSAVAAPSKAGKDPFVGYLISTFTDTTPAVQWWLSKNNDPGSYTFLNSGLPILTSSLGTRGVRDVFLTSNSARTKWFLLATDLDVHAKGFSWGVATSKGSRGIVVWESEDLVHWGKERLVIVEDERAGMVWAPSAVYDEGRGEWDVFWSSRFYQEGDWGHVGRATQDVIRTARTRDFLRVEGVRDWVAVEGTGLIDQEVVRVEGGEGWVRWLKNETLNQIYQEVSEDGLFGKWKRVEGYVRKESPREGTAVFRDNAEKELWHMFLDDYTQYVPYETRDIRGGVWTPSNYRDFPKGLKHGSVTPLTRKEYDAVAARYIK